MSTKIRIHFCWPTPSMRVVHFELLEVSSVQPLNTLQNQSCLDEMLTALSGSVENPGSKKQTLTELYSESFTSSIS